MGLDLSLVMREITYFCHFSLILCGLMVMFSDYMCHNTFWSVTFENASVKCTAYSIIIISMISIIMFHVFVTECRCVVTNSTSPNILVFELSMPLYMLNVLVSCM